MTNSRRNIKVGFNFTLTEPVKTLCSLGDLSRSTLLYELSFNPTHTVFEALPTSIHLGQISYSRCNVKGTRYMFTNIAKGTTDPGIDCFDQ